MIDFATALASLAPNAAWSLTEDDYDNISWYSPEIAQPTREAVVAEQARLQAIEDANAYKALRAAEYPSIVDQLDTLYHGGFDAWKATIQAVKDKYPKEQA